MSLSHKPLFHLTWIPDLLPKNSKHFAVVDIGNSDSKKYSSSSLLGYRKLEDHAHAYHAGMVVQVYVLVQGQMLVQSDWNNI